MAATVVNAVVNCSGDNDYTYALEKYQEGTGVDMGQDLEGTMVRLKCLPTLLPHSKPGKSQGPEQDDGRPLTRGIPTKTQEMNMKALEGKPIKKRLPGTPRHTITPIPHTLTSSKTLPDGTLDRQDITSSIKFGRYTFLTIFTVLTDTKIYYKACLYWIATLPLEEKPPLVACINKPATQVHVLRELQ